MNASLNLQRRTFPSRIAELGFSAQLPGDWILHELPPEEPAFSNPANFLPLAVVAAPHAAIVFAFAARPAYEDGTLHDWAWYLLNQNGLKPRAVGAHQVGLLPAIVGEATQESDLGPMVVRFAFCEDGGRLINITLSAPELLADSVRGAWFAMLESFALETPRGSRFATETIAPRQPSPAGAEEAPNAESSKSGEIPATPEPTDPTAAAPNRGNTFASHALEDDTTSLDQATTINANLRDQGVGLVPHVVAADSDAKRATVASGAIMARFDVPYGWHVIDDGRRTLVFEPSGQVQINLNLIARSGRDRQGILDEIESETRASYPSPEFVRLKDGDIEALGVRNIQDGGQPLEQYHLLIAGRDAQSVLRARVTATPDRSTDACNLAQLILESVVFGDESATGDDKPIEGDNAPEATAAGGQPAWWREALALEAADKLEEAEKRIQHAVPHIGCPASIAEMYRLRMVRLLRYEDRAGAREAFKQADRWITFYASCATSGGEGAALSLERDDFRARLIQQFGSDPSA